jgi:hypothetical protein
MDLDLRSIALKNTDISGAEIPGANLAGADLVVKLREELGPVYTIIEHFLMNQAWRAFPCHQPAMAS